jgi:uncharacterized protein YbbK (DUF523 family)
MILISACLIGINSKYDGGNNFVESYVKLVKSGKAIPFCPEQVGGLPTPRSPSEIVGGDGNDVLDGKAKVMTRNGEDVTKAFVKGAQETLKLAKLVNAEKVILKTNSPSCGSKFVYDGSFTGQKRQGAGVTAALLMRNGIKILDSE